MELAAKWRTSSSILGLLFLLLAKAASQNVLPHDVHPGFSVKKFSTNTSPNIIEYKILDPEYSKFFTVLGDGLVMTTSDLSPLINQRVNLFVFEQTPNSTSTHLIPIYVLDRREMLQFKPDVLQAQGEVIENAPAGTKVENVPVLLATSIHHTSPIMYKFVSGNEDGAFSFQDSVNMKIQSNLTVEYANRGVWLVTGKPLDKERKDRYVLNIQASDLRGVNKALAKVTVNIVNENENAPIFIRNAYRFSVNGTKLIDNNGNATISWKRFISIGKVEAFDEDGDKIAYSIASPNNLMVIVPQTGELMLTGEPLTPEVEVLIEAHDLATPSLKSKIPAKVVVEFLQPPMDEDKNDEIDNELHPEIHHREKRRVTRAVRPTKRIEFTEADGETEGRSVFQLEKETDRETFKIRDENVWVTVESSGVVKVKKKWDFEELGPEKTIDFWVTISNAGNGGEFSALHIFLVTIRHRRYFQRPLYKIFH